MYFDDEFIIVCGFGDILVCCKVFFKYNSFYKYVRRKYVDIYRGWFDLLLDG